MQHALPGGEAYRRFLRAFIKENHMMLLLTALFLVLAISSFCSLAEATFLSLNPIRLETRKNEGRRHAAQTLVLRKHLGRTVAAILILNTVANTGGAALTGGLFDSLFGGEWLWLFSLLFTVVVLFGAEIVPKVIGVTYGERIAPWISPVLRLSIAALQPVIALTDRITRWIQRGRAADDPSISMTDLSTMARLAREEQLIGRHQEQIIVNTSRLKTLTAREIMVSRDNIIYLRLSAAPEANLQTAQLAAHTRYPVSETEALDSVMGYVNGKEILYGASGAAVLELRRFIRPLLSVSPDATAESLLSLLIQRRSHIAVVRPAGGKIIGLITLEDILEEIVGEIEDEFDWISSEVVEMCPNAWRVGGAARLEAVAHHIRLELSGAERGLSMHEWLSGRLGGPVRIKAFYSGAGAKFYVHKIRRKHIVEVVVEGRPTDYPAAPEP
jgi:putative hemolysin